MAKKLPRLCGRMARWISVMDKFGTPEGTLLALATVLSFAGGALVMDVIRDRDAAAKPHTAGCLEAPIHCSILERSGIRFCILSKADQ